MPSIRNQKKAVKKATITRVGDASAVQPVVLPLSPSQRLRALAESDPYTEAFSSGSSWGDLEEPVVFGSGPTLEELVERVADDLRMQEENIWKQPWSDRLATYYADTYDLRDLTEGEYEACMHWLYEKGWDIRQEDRAGVKAYPDNLPPRVWVKPEVQVVRTVQVKEKKKMAPVPRFCRNETCADVGCRYVHGDTMPRLNEPCNFGSSCGASDPVKRALCIRMHPGEKWTADLVVHRPVSVVSVVQ